MGKTQEEKIRDLFRDLGLSAVEAGLEPSFLIPNAIHTFLHHNVDS